VIAPGATTGSHCDSVQRVFPWRRLLLGTIALGICGLIPPLWAEIDPPALREAERALSRSEAEKALIIARDHLRWRPYSRKGSLLAALSLSKLNRALEAETFYRRAGKLTTEALHERALGLVRSNCREEAIKALDEILGRDPNDLIAMRRKAGVLISQSRWWDAEVLAGRISRHPHGRVIGRTLEGLAHLRQGNYEQSVAAFEEVLMLDPLLGRMPLQPPSLFWANLGEGLLKLGRAADAERLLNRPLASNNDPVLAGLMSRACQQLGDLENAERWWKLTTDWDPSLPGPWLELGRLALIRNQPAEAVSLLQKAASLSPHSPDPLYSLSQAFRQLGKPHEADRLLTVARGLKQLPPPPAVTAQPPAPPSS
jgi:tetratricopeptide (TPR) repeat protein